MVTTSVCTFLRSAFAQPGSHLKRNSIPSRGTFASKILCVLLLAALSPCLATAGEGDGPIASNIHFDEDTTVHVGWGTLRLPDTEIAYTTAISADSGVVISAEDGADIDLKISTTSISGNTVTGLQAENGGIIDFSGSKVTITSNPTEGHWNGLNYEIWRPHTYDQMGTGAWADAGTIYVGDYSEIHGYNGKHSLYATNSGKIYVGDNAKLYSTIWGSGVAGVHANGAEIVIGENAHIVNDNNGEYLGTASLYSQARAVLASGGGTVRIGSGSVIETQGGTTTGNHAVKVGLLAQMNSAEIGTIILGDNVTIKTVTGTSYAISASSVGSLVRTGKGAVISTAGSAAYAVYAEYGGEIVIGENSSITTTGTGSTASLSATAKGKITIGSGSEIISENGTFPTVYAGRYPSDTTSGGGIIVLGDNVSVRANAANGYGLYAAYESLITAGDGLSITTAGTTGVGANAYRGGIVEIGDDATITTSGTQGYGLYANSGIGYDTSTLTVGTGMTIKTTGATGVGVYCSANSVINVGDGLSISTANGSGIVAASGGVINTKGLTIRQTDLSDAAMYASGTDTKIVGTGTMDIENYIYAANGGTLDLTFADKSLFAGEAYIFPAGATSIGTVNLTFKKGAEWEITGQSYITSLDVDGGLLTMDLDTAQALIYTDTATLQNGAAVDFQNIQSNQSYLLIDSQSAIAGTFTNVMLGGVLQDLSDTMPNRQRYRNGLLLEKRRNNEELWVSLDGLVWNNLGTATAHGFFYVVTEDTIDEVLANNTTTDAYVFDWDGKTLTKTGEGTLHLKGDNTYTGQTIIEEGKIVIYGGTGLGVNPAADVEISDGATLEMNAESGNFTLDKEITGEGDLVKEGYATVTLTQQNSGFTGTVYVNDGTLALTQQDALENSELLKLEKGTALTSPGEQSLNEIVAGDQALIDLNGQTLTVGSFSMDDDFGTVKVNGDAVFQTDGEYTFKYGQGAADHDLLLVTGDADLNDAVATPVNVDINKDITGEWKILESTGGLNGTRFSDAAVPAYVFLDAGFEYRNTDSEVWYVVSSNGKGFTDFAMTPNQISTAGGLDSLDHSSELYSSLINTVTDPGKLPNLYDQLSGEIHATLHGFIQDSDRMFARMIRNRLWQPTCHERGCPIWATFEGYYASADGNYNAAGYRASTYAGNVGFEKYLDNYIFGSVFRFGGSNLRVRHRTSEADLNNYHLAMYGVRQGDGLQIMLGTSYAYYDTDTVRNVVEPSIQQQLVAGYSNHSVQIFAEVVYNWMSFDDTCVHPYFSFSWNLVHHGEFLERGGNAALHGAAQTNNHAVTMLGTRVYQQSMKHLTFEVDVYWQHLWGSRDPWGTFAFAGGDNFGIRGAAMSSDALGLSLSANVQILDNLHLRFTYDGQFGDDSLWQGGTVTAESRF